MWESQLLATCWWERNSRSSPVSRRPRVTASWESSMAMTIKLCLATLQVCSSPSSSCRSRALIDADVLLYVTDVVETPTKNQDFLDKVAKEKIPVLLVINKIDLLTGGQQELEALVAQWKELLPQAEVYPTSALHNFNVDNIMKRIVELLPESPPYFGKDALTDRNSRFFVTEIVREKILLTYDKEVPYATQVIVEKFDEDDKSIHIMAVIYVERDSQKGIIIGHQGKKLKHVGIEARKDIEKFFEKRVFLELFVKVEKDWRNQENKLRQFGYIE